MRERFNPDIPVFHSSGYQVMVPFTRNQLFYLVEVVKVDTPRKHDDWEVPGGFPSLMFKLLYFLGEFFGEGRPSEVKVPLSDVEILAILHNVSYNDKWSDGTPVGAQIIQSLALAVRELHFKEQIGYGFGEENEPTVAPDLIKKAVRGKRARKDSAPDRDPGSA